jgi:hypothetical protein
LRMHSFCLSVAFEDLNLLCQANLNGRRRSLLRGVEAGQVRMLGPAELHEGMPLES